MYLNKHINLILENFDPILNKDGAYSKSGKWNNILWIENKPYRERVEALVFDDNNNVFLELKNNDIGYRLPGGGIERGIPNEKQIFEECKEEARILIKNIIDTNINYIKIFTLKESEWMIKEGLPYYGQFTKIYLAEFDKYFSGHISPEDEDINMVKNGKFYPTSYLKRKEHLLAIKKRFY